MATQRAATVRRGAPASSSTTSRAARCTSGPSPYVGTYLLLRIDDRAGGTRAGAAAAPVVESGRPSADPAHDTSITVAFTYHGLEALGVPQDSLDSFAPEFRQGMAARAAELGDVGDSSPEHWEKPLGTADVHVAVAVLSPDAARLEAVVERARRAHAGAARRRADLAAGLLPAARPDARRSASRTASASPRSRAAADPPTNPQERPIKAGEIILGYPDETGELPPMPTPEVLGRNGTYVVFRKLHTRVAAYRQYLRAQGSQPRRGGAARRQDGRALAERRAARALARRATTPSSAATRSATTTSSTATIRAASSAPPARTRGARTRATRSTTKAASTCASTG